MDEAHDDYLERLQAARMRALIAAMGVRVCELAVLFSTFEGIVRSALLLDRGDVPPDELSGVPDPDELLMKEEDMPTGEAVEILRAFLDMSAKGEAKLWDVLNLTTPDE
jgi:hypothetical protein